MDLNTEVERRYNLFFENDVKDIKDWNKKFPDKKIGYEILIVDEFADLQFEKDSIQLIAELGRKARACGIHLIVSTQRPDYTILNGGIKANITNVLGLKTMNGRNSEIIIDQTGLERLHGKGHGLFKRGNIVEVQSPFLDVDTAKELIKHTYIDKTAKTEDKIEEIDISKLEVFQ